MKKLKNLKSILIEGQTLNDAIISTGFGFDYFHFCQLKNDNGKREEEKTQINHDLHYLCECSRL